MSAFWIAKGKAEDQNEDDLQDVKAASLQSIGAVVFQPPVVGKKRKKLAITTNEIQPAKTGGNKSKEK